MPTYPPPTQAEIDESKRRVHLANIIIGTVCVIAVIVLIIATLI